jgi:hypothetical protein
MKLKKLRISLLLKSAGNIASSLPKHLVVDSNPAAASFYIRGPQPKGWHRGQKYVPRFYAYVAEYC